MKFSLSISSLPSPFFPPSPFSFNIRSFVGAIIFHARFLLISFIHLLIVHLRNAFFCFFLIIENVELHLLSSTWVPESGGEEAERYPFPRLQTCEYLGGVRDTGHCLLWVLLLPYKNANHAGRILDGSTYPGTSSLVSTVFFVLLQYFFGEQLVFWASFL